MMTRRKVGILLLIGAGLVAVAVWRIEAVSAQKLAARYAMPGSSLPAEASQKAVSDGYRLARVNGCFGCHGDRLNGQVVFEGWFGTRITAPNLTRIVRKESNRQLVAAIRYGIKADGTSLVEMPADRFVKLSDQDLSAILAYLRSLPLRADRAPATRWRFGGRVLVAVGLMPLEARLVDRSQKGPVQTPKRPLALGHYITSVQCTVCHGADLSGDTANDSPDLHIAIKDYSLPSFEQFFRTGKNRIGHKTPVMADMIRSQFQYLAPADVEAIYDFLHADRGAPADIRARLRSEPATMR